MSVATLVIFISHLLMLTALVPNAAAQKHANRLANKYAPIIISEMERVHSDLSPKLIAAMGWPESGYDDDAVSSKGAIGFLQVMPNDPHAKKYTIQQLKNPRINIRVALEIIEDSRKSCRRIVADQLGYDDPRMWLSRYAGYGCQETVYANNILRIALLADNS